MCSANPSNFNEDNLHASEVFLGLPNLPAPTPQTPDLYANVPTELKTLGNWLLWKLEERDGRMTKVPYQPNGRRADVTAPRTWNTFDDCVRALQTGRFSGIGFVFAKGAAAYGGVDLDKCRDPQTGVTEPWAAQIIKELGSYAELSQSKTGWHIIVKNCELPVDGGRNKRVEMYCNGRYFCMTGDRAAGSTEIRSVFLANLYQRMVEDRLDPNVAEEVRGRPLNGRDISPSGEDYKIIASLARELRTEDPTVIESEIARSYPERYRSQNEKHGDRKGDTYWHYSIARFVERQRQQAGTESSYTRDAREKHTAETYVESGTSPTPTRSTEAVHPNVELVDGVFYGLIGRIIQKLQPETESHPIGNLLELMTSVGSMIGRTAYYQVESTKHFCNLFFVRVGITSRSRKGTGKDRIAEIMHLVNPRWLQYQNTSGLGSGEGVIWAIRDKLIGPIQNKRTKQWTIDVIDPGVENKTLHISEGEFVGVLTVTGRKDNILSKVIRDGWDCKPLRNTIKTSPCSCAEPYISQACDITKKELLRALSESERFNGFANRYLWVHVERQGSKPHGGEPIDWTTEVQELRNALEFARKQNRVYMDRNAHLRWERMYADLGVEEPGLVGAVTARAEPQVLRMALIFALLDLSDHIRVEHLEAANAVWQYCLASAKFIFGETAAMSDSLTEDQSKLLGFLKSGPKTKTQISVDCFKRNKFAAGITLDLEALKKQGLIIEDKDATGMLIFITKGCS